MEQNPKKVSTNSSVLLKNTRDRAQLKQLIIKIVKYNIPTSLIYKYKLKKKLRDFSGETLKEIKQKN